MPIASRLWNSPASLMPSLSRSCQTPNSPPARAESVQHAVAVGVERAQPLEVGARARLIRDEGDLLDPVDDAIALEIEREQPVFGRNPGDVLAPAVAVDIEVDVGVVEVHELQAIAVEVEGHGLPAAAKARTVVLRREGHGRAGAIGTGDCDRERIGPGVFISWMREVLPGTGLKDGVLVGVFRVDV